MPESELKKKDEQICIKWREMRVDRLTASDFGDYGRLHESKAIQMYENLTERDVRKCLLVDVQHPFLDASPNGLAVPLQQAFSAPGGKICVELDVQGKLNKCNREYCDFVLYGRGSILVDRIQKHKFFVEECDASQTKTFLHAVYVTLNS
ncbi:hypothetical protein PR048_023296 [Dryococelus australis]|uniref:Uncharacterized protein n=1 Tax=Dryococelus australis TaxID=614101 RepID=A0ABQ9GTN5_9NEOP|nr:hypothetical protein PR048_023296 [Dryococelus australis]